MCIRLGLRFVFIWSDGSVAQAPTHAPHGIDLRRVVKAPAFSAFAVLTKVKARISTTKNEEFEYEDKSC